MVEHRNPLPTVDVIIEIAREDGRNGIILIKRKNPPPGWALPGGFVEYGESLEDAAVREAREETSLDIELVSQFHTYSAPGRDPRCHTISTVYIAKATGRPRAQDDAREIGIFIPEDKPYPLAFDHDKILADFYQARGRKNPGRGDKRNGRSSPRPLKKIIKKTRKVL
jgi:ADP-ribose pyrophosphatase YjhB (NUDIX family)